MSSGRSEPAFQPVIAVTEGDYQYALRHNRYNCAIVRAIQRQFPDATRVLVDTQRISFSLDDDRRYDAPTPKNAVDKLIKPFDELGSEAAPKQFSFKLRGVTSREVQHLDRRARTQKRATQRSGGTGKLGAGKNINNLPHCEYNRFREDLPETAVSE